MTKTYHCESRVWLYPGKSAWHFVIIPVEVTKDIDQMFAHAKRGWGSLPVTVTIGETSWNTSIFPDKKTGTYLLPVKAIVRKSEGLSVDDMILFDLTISD